MMYSTGLSALTQTLNVFSSIRMTTKLPMPNVFGQRASHTSKLHVGLNWDINRILNPITTKNLEFLSTVDLSTDSQDEHLKILAQIPTLRYLVITCPHPSPELLDRLAQAAPCIEGLQFY